MERSTCCEICKSSERRYQCPRCNVQYCSVTCYKSESHLSCSEEFYKECIRDEVRSRELEGDTSESRKKMCAILENVNESFNMNDIFSSEGDDVLDSDDDSKDDEEIDLAERVKGVDLDDKEALWSVLSILEKLQFEEILKSGDVASIVPPFIPWWDTRQFSPMGPKSLLQKWASRKELFKSPPATCVCNNVANVLAAYACAVRLYNGDHEEHFQDATVTMVVTSKNLSTSENFPDFQSAIQSAFLEITGCEFLKGSIDEPGMIEHDVIRMFRGPTDNFVIQNCYVLQALNDIHNLFSMYVKKGTKTKEHKTSSGEFSKKYKDHSIFESSYAVPNSKVKQLLKKIEYFFCWTVEHYTKPLGV